MLGVSAENVNSRIGNRLRVNRPLPASPRDGDRLAIQSADRPRPGAVDGLHKNEAQTAGENGVVPGCLRGRIQRLSGAAGQRTRL